MVEDSIFLHNVQSEEFLQQDALHRLFVDIFPEYAEVFPTVKFEIQHGSQFENIFLPHYWLIQKNDRAIGVALSRYLIKSNIGFFRYLGVDPAHRRSGIGTLTIQALKKQFYQDASDFGNPVPLGYCFEVEDPAWSQDEGRREIDQRRLNFFKKRGAFVLPVDYLEPVLEVRENKEGARPKPMLLMLQPIDRKLKFVDSKKTQELVIAVWTEHYGLDLKDPTLQVILNSIPDTEDER